MRSIVARFCLLVFCLPGAISANPPASGKIRVLLTYGGHGFEEKQFFAMFDKFADVQYTKAALPQAAGLLRPGLEKDYDVIARYDMVDKFAPEQEKAFAELMQRGIGLVALHHDLGAHRQWPEYTKIVGGRYCFDAFEAGGKKFGPSGYDHGQEMKVTVADRNHPITRGLADFTIHDETYCRFYVAPDAHILLTTSNPKNDPAIAWTHEYGKSRVFYFQLGHDSKAWACPAYPEILARGIRWAAGK
jgi:uncharacterized protein